MGENGFKLDLGDARTATPRLFAERELC
jgi:hypothetical protein